MNNDLAKQITDRLDEAGIAYSLVTEKPLMDEVYIGANYDPPIVLKLNAADFSKGHAALEAHYSAMITQVEDDYYLLGFSNAELVAILAKPDEWNTFDFLLAKKLLLERNAGVDESAIERLKQFREQELSRPENTPWAILLIGYAIVAAGIYGVWYLMINKYSPFLFSLVISAFLGANVHRSIKVLPDGNSVPAYSKKAQLHGNIIFYASVVLLFTGSIAFILWLKSSYE